MTEQKVNDNYKWRLNLLLHRFQTTDMTLDEYNQSRANLSDWYHREILKVIGQKLS